MTYNQNKEKTTRLTKTCPPRQISDRPGWDQFEIDLWNCYIEFGSRNDFNKKECFCMILIDELITRLTLRPLWKHLVGFAVFGHSTAHSWHLHSMLIEFRIASRYTSFGMCFTFPLSRNPNLGFKFEGWCDGQAGSRCVNHHIAPKKTTSGLKIYLGWNYPTINKQRKQWGRNEAAMKPQWGRNEAANGRSK